MSDRILVADDSQNMRDILKMSLETFGYNVILAEDGERALERIMADHPDLLIVDIMMPKVNGFQICRRVKSDPATRTTPVILLTARVQEEDVFWGRDCGADEYITKPFRTEELQQTINRLLKRRQDEASRARLGTLDEQRQRLAGGGESQIVMFRWDTRAMDVFRKKYGEIRFSEALRALRAESERFLAERKDPGPVAVHVPFGLSVVVTGAPTEAMQIGHALVKRLNELAITFYDVGDRECGHIAFRDPRSGREARLPLLSFTARIDPETEV